MTPTLTPTLTPVLTATLALLAVLPLLVLLLIGCFPGFLLSGPPRPFFYRLHRRRQVVLRISILAWLGLVWLWWTGRAAATWPVATGIVLALVLVVYFLCYPLHAFRPIRRPVFRSAEEVDLPPDLPVIGVPPGQGAPPRAYTLAALIQPHGAIDTSGEQARMVTWCSLANTGSVIRLDSALGPLERLHTATAINDNICFYHPDTDNLVQQIESRVVCGPAAGQRLETDPVLPVTWAVWRELYPDTQVCDMPRRRLAEWLLRGLMLRVHEGLPERKAPFHRMDRPPDPRLPLMTRVLALEVGGEARSWPCSWPCSWIYERRVVSLEVGGEPLVLLGDESRQLTVAFSRRVEGSGEVLELSALEESRGVQAARSEDDSVWDLAGRCVAGPRAGERLASVPHFPSAYWYAWARAHPKTRLPKDDHGVPLG